jgi:hypothetical protein
MQLVVEPQLFEHPEGTEGAGVLAVVELEGRFDGHCVSS